jgi:hypothetical protein
MNTVMRTLGGALGGQLSATFIAAHSAKGHPAVTGFTESFVMATGFLVVCFIAGLLVPKRRAEQSPGADEHVQTLVETGERQVARV